MKNNEKWGEKNKETWWKIEEKAMKHDEQETKNNETWWKIVEKTRKHDEP